MSESKVLIVKRNTAIKLAGKLTASAIGMLRPDVDEGSFMFNFDPTLNESSILLDAFDEKATREWNQHTTEPFPMKWWISAPCSFASAPCGHQSDNFSLCLAHHSASDAM